jgi:chorismate lyase / 3-hydroxybenzoate synthase
MPVSNLRTYPERMSPVSLSEPKLQPEDSLSCHYSEQPIEQLLGAEGVLAVISNGPTCQPGNDPRHYHCGLVSLSQRETHEVWSVASAVQTGREGLRQWSLCDDMLFVAQWVEDKTAPSQRDAIYQTYASLLTFINDLGYPEIVRMWNYMPDINHGERDEERYRQFCLGRQQAFAESAYDRDAYPSACALGHAGDQTVIYLLASRTPAVHIENPRQESAYNYPREHGPASPSFARASLVNWPRSKQLFISGTASIVGHKSHFPNDVSGQLQTTFDNIDALLSRCAYHAGMNKAPAVNMLKAYIRNTADYKEVETRVQQHFPGVPAQFLQANICRPELLVEIDGLCELPGSAVAPLSTKSQRA